MEDLSVVLRRGVHLRSILNGSLLGGWHAVTVYEELPVKVARSSFYRFLTRHKLNDRGRAFRRVVPEIVHLPGEALLIDWGYLWMVEESGKRVKLWAFIGILGYSRYLVVRLMTGCDAARTLSELGGMYQELGGVPLRTTSGTLYQKTSGSIRRR